MKKATAKSLLYVVLILLSLIFMLPFLWLLSTALKGYKQIFKFPPEWIPTATKVIICGEIHLPQAFYNYDVKKAIAEQHKKLKDHYLRIAMRKPQIEELTSKVSYKNEVLVVRFSRWTINKIEKDKIIFYGGDIEPPGTEEKFIKAGKVSLVSSEGNIIWVENPFPITIKNATCEVKRYVRFYWENFVDVFMELPIFLHFIKNSIFVTLLSIIGTVLSSSLVAYSFARLRWPGRNVIFIILLSTMMLPGQVTMIPVFVIYKTLGWVDTLKPLWVSSFLGNAFFIFMLRQFFLTLPKELEESAVIDGCGYLRIFWKIMLPQVTPALIAVVIWQFMSSWNDFMGPLIYINTKEKMTLPLGLQFFQTIHGSDYALMMAASFMMTLPVIIVFFVAQRYFIEGITLTGIKE
jgi:multiple sugar transport system permease protein